tara:strand:+ start:727 stop:1383 length:657 start_codon:yes stop_codon:yes gene_type:complete
LTIKAFLFSDDEFFNSIIEEQFSSLQEYDLIVYKKITNITKAQQFEKDDIVLSYSVEQNEILKIKKFLSQRSYSFPAIIFGSLEEVSTLEKNSFIFFDTPFNFIELLKIIENIVLQRDIIEYSNLKFKKLNLDMNARIIKGLDKTVRLTDKEAKILWHLIDAKGSTITHDYLLNKVWGYKKNIETKTLTTHIYTIRKKIIPFKDILSIESSEDGYCLK